MNDRYTSEDYNKVTVTFEWPPDKYMGHQAWQEQINLLLRVAENFGLDSGKAAISVLGERDDWEDE